jgi:hypothetical protein
MREEEWPDEGYPCRDCADAADEHEVHPLFDPLSWREGFARGYEEERIDGEHLGHQALRADLLHQLATLVCDVRLGLRHDLGTPQAVLHQVAGLVEKR